MRVNDKMTSKERILTAIAIKEPDRVPVSPVVTARMVQNMSKSEWEQILKLTDVIFATNAGGDVYLGREVDNRVKKFEKGKVINIEIHTPKGILTGMNQNEKDTMWQVEPFLKEEKDVEKFLSFPYRCSEIKAEDYFKWEKTIGNEGLVWIGVPSPIKLPFSYFGSEQFYLKIAEDLDLIEELTKIGMDRTKEYLEKCCKIGVKHFWLGGSEYCGPAAVNPNIFERLIVKYDKQLVDLIHKYDGIVHYHIHGKLRKILDSIVEIGADLVTPIERPPGGDISLREAKERIGDRVCLQGNIDDLGIINCASKEEIQKMAIACIRDAGKRGGYILSGTDTKIYRPRWVENFIIMAETAKRR